MVKQAYIRPGVPTLEEPLFKFNNLNDYSQSYTPTYSSFRCPQNDTINSSLADCVLLELDNLKCFEVVERQYESSGIIFHNCIAIEPSNPAFPPHSGVVVLMGSPHSGLLEATFVRPVNFVSAFVTSSQRLVLSAYDRDRQLLNQAVLPCGNLANSDSGIAPNVLLSVSAQNIHSVSFRAFDGQFTIDDLGFRY
ncbi:MAG: hypothetical protein HC836_48520 [Richelia sp. RM2_1_2]|nr:hypothetical protein [Richelia sp. SM2_1_7]NJM17434.1 hypothetical protein [Richelia sp. SM1_7_0]NJN10342.1 hypothetical protein [Richelia sp. RM1_1_1]NJO30862.1 hypothetical protein [Richelia sp. SL_2_1]NJO65651.1 hypothetical protein [Richelia sp. RM2_1_2]